MASPDGRDSGDVPGTLPVTDLADIPADEVRWLGTHREARYTLGTELGRGGMGEVHTATDSWLGRTIAVKTLRYPGERPGGLFLREVRVTARLVHPSIPPIHDLGVDPTGRPYYTMPVVDGEALSSLLLTGRPPTLRERFELFRRVCEAVAYAHAHGVVHRDLKPANIMIGRFGEVIVLDWGVAAELGREPDREVLGTPDYMAPEQFAGGPVGPATDVYSLGRLAHLLATDQLPERSSAASPSAIDRRVPRALDAIVRKATAPAPADRYPDADALRSDVQAWLDDREVSVLRRTRFERALRWAVRHASRLIATAVVGGGLLGIGTVAVGVAVQLHLVAVGAARDRAAANLVAAHLALAEDRAHAGRSEDAHRELDLARAAADGIAVPPARFAAARAVVARNVPPPILWQAAPIPSKHVPFARFDGRRIAVATDDAWLVTPLDGPTAGVATRADLPPGQISGAAWAGDRLLAGYVAPPRVEEVLGGKRLWTGEGEDRPVPLPSGGWVAVTPSSVTRYAPDGARLGVDEVDGAVHTFSDDGVRALRHRRLTAEQPDELAVIDLVQDRTLLALAGPRPDPALSHSGDRLLVAGVSSGVAMVDLDRGQVRWTVACGPVDTLMFSADDRRVLARSGSQVRVWRSEDGAPIGSAVVAGTPEAWSDGLLLAVATDGGGLYAVPEGAPSALIHPDLEDLDVAADGHLLVTAGYDPSLRVWEAETGTLLARFPSPAAGTRDLSISVDGARAAMVDRIGGFEAVDLANGAVTARVAGDYQAVVALPDGTFAAGVPNGVVRLDPRDGAVLTTWSGGPANPWALVVSPDGRWLVATGRQTSDPWAVGWELATGRAVAAGPIGLRATTAAFVGNRMVAVSLSGAVASWIPGDPESVEVFREGGGPALGVASTDDGVVIGTMDGRLEWWTMDPVPERVHVTDLVDATIGPVVRIPGTDQVMVLAGSEALRLDLRPRDDDPLGPALARHGLWSSAVDHPSTATAPTALATWAWAAGDPGALAATDWSPTAVALARGVSPGCVPPHCLAGPAEFEPPVEHRPAALSVASVPVGAQVSVDGERVGIAPWTGSTPAGPHVVTLRSGQQEYRFWVDAPSVVPLCRDLDTGGACR